MPRPRQPRLTPVLAVLLILVACADPVDDSPGRGEAAENPLGSEEPDPARDALVTEVEALTRLLSSARDRLDEATQAGELTGAHSAAADVLELLVGDPTEGPSALFPLQTTDRGAGSDREDQLTAVLTVAREAGGTAGGDVRETLRDLVAGDLGSWQRDADGMMDLVEATATSTDSLEATEQEVFELPGEATRALAWTLLTERADDLDAARAYAERGVAHLDVAVTALTALELEAS